MKEFISVEAFPHQFTSQQIRVSRTFQMAFGQVTAQIILTTHRINHRVVFGYDFLFGRIFQLQFVFTQIRHTSVFSLY